MLLKLFRHDFRGLSRWMWPVMIGIGGAALLGFFNTLVLGRAGSFYDDAYSGAGQEVLLISSVGGTALVAMALAAAATVVAVLIFVKFYKTMVTDEAYLTFTLPVTAGQLIASKFLSALVWTVIGGAVILAAWFLILGGLLLSAGPYFRGDVAEILEDVFRAMGENIGDVLLVGLYAVSGAVRTYFQISCAILFGASVVRKNKALAAVGMIFAVNFAVNLILSLFGISGLFQMYMNAAFDMGSVYNEMSVSFMMWIQIAVNAVLIAVFWWWSWRIAKKSVNIE